MRLVFFGGGEKFRTFPPSPLTFFFVPGILHFVKALGNGAKKVKTFWPHVTDRKACNRSGTKFGMEVNFVLFFKYTKATKLNSLRKFLFFTVCVCVCVHAHVHLCASCFFFLGGGGGVNVSFIAINFIFCTVLLQCSRHGVGEGGCIVMHFGHTWSKMHKCSHCETPHVGKSHFFLVHYYQFS